MTKIEEKAIETYPEEEEYDDITELRFLRIAYLKGAKDMKELILKELNKQTICDLAISLIEKLK